MAEEQMQQLRSKATELLLREEWSESVEVYSQFINLCQNQINQTPDNLPKLHKSLCLALSNRASARSRLRDYTQALKDCDEALKIESTHFKTLVCKGKILLNLNRYSMALGCFKTAQLDPQANGSSVGLNGYLQKCKKLELMSKTGAFDLSEWVANGFRAKPPEAAEYIGAVEMRRSGIRGRGLFATKNMEAGSLVLISKAVATERGILPGHDLDENAQLVMWKNFTENVLDSVTKCSRICSLISTLSSGEDEDELEVPAIDVFKPEFEQIGNSEEKKVDASRILSILDVNSIVEDSISSKVLGKNSDYYGVGIWILASFINHSCIPNARRVHVGDYVIVHASRDVKAGEELTFAYFDVLNPLEKRNEMSKTWGFRCNCRRCKFEAELCSRQEGVGEIEMGLDRGLDSGAVVFKLEEGMRKWKVKEKEKGYLRASFWTAYGSEKLMRSWGRRIPTMESVVDSIVEAVGSDERVLKMVVEKLKKGNGGSSVVEVERALKLGRGVYGKVMKKQAMKSLLGLGILEPIY
ncbi:methyltransferase FGSG_00040 [Argentina anserina]|uniref:methyltransferase FGSG_00040 n=1 Tax=Argentina anserina TaxID=57926 RepID=UPI00217627E6|nr:methyltransferase FGSG_00040 [Potentilla anserina]